MLNEAEQIGAALASARAEGVELIAVDGGSSDGTPERAAAAGARVIRSAPPRARQLGAGAGRTGADAIVFLHADTRLPPGFDTAVRAALRDPAVVGGAFRFRFDQPSLSLRVVEWGARLRCALFDLPYGDQALFVRREVLERIGGVPQAPILEDLDLVKAMRRHGRLTRLRLPATTSARRYRAGGVFRTMFRHWLVASAWLLGLDRERIAAWYGR